MTSDLRRELAEAEADGVVAARELRALEADLHHRATDAAHFEELLDAYAPAMRALRLRIDRSENLEAAIHEIERHPLMSTLRTHHSWRFRTAWRPHRRPANRQEALDALQWLRAHAPPAELKRAWSRIAGRQLVPMAERLRLAREMRERFDRLDGVATRAQAPNVPTLEENWKAAGRSLTGQHWRTWNRINQHMGGLSMMALSREDKAFVRGIWCTGGRHLVDSERR